MQRGRDGLKCGNINIKSENSEHISRTDLCESWNGRCPKVIPKKRKGWTWAVCISVASNPGHSLSETDTHGGRGGMSKARNKSINSARTVPKRCEELCEYIQDFEIDIWDLFAEYISRTSSEITEWWWSVAYDIIHTNSCPSSNIKC